MPHLAAATALAVLCGGIGADGQGYRRSPNRRELVTSPRMHEVLAAAALPTELDWRWKDGRNYTTVSRNQHIPKYCGACYAFGATSAFSDRIRIARGGVGREINTAMQVVLNCDTEDFGCSGGDASTVYSFISQMGGIPDETCQAYEAVGHDTGRQCRLQDICQQCDASGCYAKQEYEVYDIEEFGSVSGEFQMMAELQRGPLACAISTPAGFLNLTGYGIFEDDTNDESIDHIISVVGYGTEDGKPYWVLRNSWGTYWGYYGWARIARGKNNIQIEHDCSWATPANKGQPKLRRVQDFASTVTGAMAFIAQETPIVAASKTVPRSAPCRANRSNWASVGGEFVVNPRPQDTVKAGDLPAAWDWRNVSGNSYATWNTNEHLPHGGCASCWAQAVASTLADRIAVQRHGRWPQVGLSPQMLINCKAGGSCAGGDPAGAYAHIRRYGITDETCQNYQALNLQCNAMGTCMNCAPGGEHGLIWPGHCVGVKQPIVWFVSEYGSVRGAAAMKAEIFQRGPIGCGLEPTKGFRQYGGGVYAERRSSPALEHQVSVAGWGVAGDREAVPKGTEFWVGRNSWGTYWGEGGWFRVRMHGENLGIELDCDWGVPESGAPVPSTLAESPGVVPAAPAVAWALGALVPLALLGAAACGLALRARRVEEEDAPYVRVA